LESDEAKQSQTPKAVTSFGCHFWVKKTSTTLAQKTVKKFSANFPAAQKNTGLDRLKTMKKIAFTSLRGFGAFDRLQKRIAGESRVA
jgi:hypothetical protein